MDGEPIDVPGGLTEAYFEAWRSVPSLLAACAVRDWDGTSVARLRRLSEFAKQQMDVADALLELSPEVVPNFLTWVEER